MSKNQIELTTPQTEFFLSQKKYNLFCGGFGSGKSEALFLRMLNTKLKRPNVDLGYFAPSYQLIRDIAYGRIQNLLDRMYIPYKLNKSENNLYIKDRGKILFRTMEVPERIIGFEIFEGYCDELDTLRPHIAQDAWQKIQARCRQVDPDDPTAINSMHAATTPEGYSFCYDRWVKNTTPDYAIIRAPTSSNPHLPEDYVRTLRESYPANLIDAYLEGKFVNLNSKSVYDAFDRHKNNTSLTLTPEDELHIGMDFNVLNMNALVHVIDDRNNPHAVAELIQLKDTPAMIEAIKFKYSNNRVHVYPDASGRSRKTIDVSKSDLSLLRDAGFIMHAKKKNPFVKDRIQCMNAKFCNGSGQRSYFVNAETCPEYVQALEQQAYDKNGVPEKDPTNSIDDINDAGGYFISTKYPINKPSFTLQSVSNF